MNCWKSCGEIGGPINLQQNKVFNKCLFTAEAYKELTMLVENPTLFIVDDPFTQVNPPDPRFNLPKICKCNIAYAAKNDCD